MAEQVQSKAVQMVNAGLRRQSEWQQHLLELGESRFMKRHSFGRPHARFPGIA
jgi:hypothetical protein